jgi:hypothetical protein
MNKKECNRCGGQVPVNEMKGELCLPCEQEVAKNVTKVMIKEPELEIVW